MTVLTCVRVGSASSEVASTSTFCTTSPGERVKSNSAACPTWSVMFLVCFPNPENSTMTLYSPAGSAGTEYSPLSELGAERENPVATLEAVTVALAMLPPEASVIFPESVAFIAWHRAESGELNRQAAQKMKGRIRSEKFHWLRITAHPPKLTVSKWPARTAVEVRFAS